MIVGKYIKRLLEDRTRVILPGFGNLEVIPSDVRNAASGNRLDPPGIKVKFDSGYSKDDGILAESVAAGEVMEREEAQQQVLELVDAIKFALDKGEPYIIPETGTFSRDEDGKTHFQSDPTWVLEPDQYGLESMDLLELDELPMEEETPKKGSSGTRATSQLTDLAPPKPKPKNVRWRVIWWVAAALIVVLVVLILVPGRENEDGERQSIFNRQPDREEVDQADAPDDALTDQEQTDDQEQVLEAESPQEEIPQEENQQEVEQEPPPEETMNFFIIAGSFSKLKNASDLQDQLKGRGYDAEVIITENRMYRVSVASYATKEEAENALTRMKNEAGLESCWLLSN
jgi:cell division protein FtsN